MPGSAPTPAKPVLARMQAGGYASLFSEGAETAAPPARRPRAGGLARAVASLMAESLRTLFPPPAPPRPVTEKLRLPAHARARSAT